MSSLVWTDNFYLHKWKRQLNHCLESSMNEEQAIEEFVKTINPSLDVDFSSDLDIVFRFKLQEILSQKHDSPKTCDENIFKYLQFTMNVAIKSQSLEGWPPTILKLPFTLIEEIFASVTITQAERLWTRLEELTEQITKPELFSKGQLLMLRTCNSLLRKLSKTYNTEFCGRIMMFIAAIYPLSEKSGLNALGQVNTGNRTFFDSEAEFLVAQREQSSADSSTMETPTEPTDRAKLVEEGEIYVDELSEYKLPHLQSNSLSAESTKAGWSVGLPYSLYQSFWKLQTCFSSELKSLDSVEKWFEIKTSLGQVFDLLSSVPSSAIADSSKTDPFADSVEGSYFGCKYLTSAKLLGLQLQDPLLRQQIACQILFYTHFMRHRPPPFTVEVTPITLVSLTGKGKDSGKPGNKIDSKNPAPGKTQPPGPVAKGSQLTPVSVTPPSALEAFLEDLRAIETKAFALLRTSTDGKSIEESIKRLFYDESRFLQWKAQGCPKYDREVKPASLSSAIKCSWEVNLAEQERCNLPRYLHGKTASFKRTLDENNRVYQFDCNISTAKEYARLLADETPSFKGFIQDYLDAEDPEQGIDDEYHPKHDSLYCWRLRRLMSKEKLSVFEFMSDGAVAQGLQRLGLLNAAQSSTDKDRPTNAESKDTTEDAEEDTMDVPEEANEQGIEENDFANPIESTTEDAGENTEGVEVVSADTPDVQEDTAPKKRIRISQ